MRGLTRESCKPTANFRACRSSICWSWRQRCYDSGDTERKVSFSRFAKRNFNCSQAQVHYIGDCAQNGECTSNTEPDMRPFTEPIIGGLLLARNHCNRRHRVHIITIERRYYKSVCIRAREAVTVRCCRQSSLPHFSLNLNNRHRLRSTGAALKHTRVTVKHGLRISEARRVRHAQRIVARVRITVHRLQIGRVRHSRVRADKTADERIIQPAIHVDETKIVQMLVIREAAPCIHTSDRVA